MPAPTRNRDWTIVHGAIAGRITRGELRHGDRLPIEPELAVEYGLGRHSVRRAVAELEIEGLVSVEQGRGTFVRSQPSIRYRIGRRTRYRENLVAQGVVPGGDFVSARIVPACTRVAGSLGIEPGVPVHRVLSRGLADGVPITLGQSFHEAARFPDLGQRRQRGDRLDAIYRDHGITDYLRRDTTIFARRPDAEEARLLDQHRNQPVMVLQKTDVDCEGRPLGCSDAIWSGHRVQFSIASLDDCTTE